MLSRFFCVGICGFQKKGFGCIRSNYGLVSRNTMPCGRLYVVKLVNSLPSIYVDDFEETMLINRNEYMDRPTCETCFEKKFMNFYRFVNHNITHRDTRFTADNNITNCSNDLDVKSTIVSLLTSKVNRPLTSVSGYQNYKTERKYQVTGLVIFGRLIDGFIESNNDCFLLEYIMNALDQSQDYTAYYIFKMVSLIELLIKNPSHSCWYESDFNKLTDFITECEDKVTLARLIIQIRNKIGHADYQALQKKADEYADTFMSNYWFDYYEYSRINWVLLNLSCKLNEMLSDIIWEYLSNKSVMENLKSI